MNYGIRIFCFSNEEIYLFSGAHFIFDIDFGFISIRNIICNKNTDKLYLFCVRDNYSTENMALYKWYW